MTTPTTRQPSPGSAREPSNPADVLRHYFAVEMTRNPSAIVDLYSLDAVFRLADVVLTGHNQLRSFYEDHARRYPRVEVDVVRAVSEGAQGVVEWTAVLYGEGGTGAVRMSGVNLAQVVDGLIVDARSFCDEPQPVRPGC